MPEPSFLSEQDDHMWDAASMLSSHKLHQAEMLNEKRRREKIYKVAGEDKKTHVSVVELYGFFSWILSAIVFIVYIIWAFVPDHILSSYGIVYIPDKYYAIAAPLWVAVTMFFSLQLYVSLCMIYTPDIESYDTLQDKFSILKNPKVNQVDLSKNDDSAMNQKLDKLSQHRNIFV